MALSYDVVVVGAGPAGSSTAFYASKGGARVLLLEEHEKPGAPAHCAGIVSAGDAEKFGLPIPEGLVKAKVGKVSLHAQGFPKVEFKAKFLILDREKLDERLAWMAAEAGAEVWTKARAVGARREGGRALVLVERGGEKIEVECGLVVGADGFESRVGRWLGLNYGLELASCLQYLARPNPLRDFMEVYVGRDYAPGGYAWLVPFGEEFKVGLGVRRAPRPAKFYLDRLVERRCPEAKILSAVGHCVPLSGPVERTFSDNLLLVGDAAGQVVPSSGAGIATSIVCGRAAGEVAAEAARSRDFSAKLLSAYQRRWRKLLGRKFDAALEIKEALERLTGEELRRIRAAAGGDFLKLLAEGKALRATAKLFLKNPRLLKYLGLALKAKRYGVF